MDLTCGSSWDTFSGNCHNFILQKVNNLCIYFCRCVKHLQFLNKVEVSQYYRYNFFTHTVLEINPNEWFWDKYDNSDAQSPSLSDPYKFFLDLFYQHGTETNYMQLYVWLPVKIL